MRNIISLHFNNIKIKNKLIITYLIVAISTLSIVCVYLTSKMKKIIVNKAIVESQRNVDIMEQQMKDIFKVATRVSDMIYTDRSLEDIITSEYDSDLERYNAYNNYDITESYLKYFEELSDITIFTENDNLINGNNISIVNDVIRNEEWYKEAVEGNGKIRWYYGEVVLNNEEQLSLVRLIKSSKGKNIGVLVININNLVLTKVNNIAPNSAMCINNKFVVPDKKNEFLETFLKDDYYELIKRDNNVNSLNNNYLYNGDYYVVMNSFKIDKSLTDIFGSVVILTKKELMGKINKAIINSFFIAICAILISLGIILYFAKNISKRITLLSKEMKRVVNGDLYVSNKIFGNDEIGQLHDDLEKMVESIRDLINQVYVQKINEERLNVRQKEAEFKMLSNQINPHFLYNTLETIRMKALLKGDKEIATIVKKLGKIMRRNLEVSGKPVTLQSEITFIKDYLEIQAMRFEGMVSFEINIDEGIDTSKYMMLPLLLQPVVENAFIHGLEEKKEKGVILINIYKENNKMIISIEDNGIGMKDEELLKLNEILDSKEDTNGSIGMKNVNQRIKIYYGNAYGMFIDSIYKVGTQVIIKLPL